MEFSKKIELKCLHQKEKKQVSGEGWPVRWSGLRCQRDETGLVMQAHDRGHLDLILTAEQRTGQDLIF